MDIGFIYFYLFLFRFSISSFLSFPICCYHTYFEFTYILKQVL